MEEEYRGRIYQDFDFTVSDFAYGFLEGLVGMEDQEDRSPILVFIKIKNKNWHRFFLDVGAGFWENWGETELDTTEWEEDEVIYVDYIEKYDLKNKQVNSIICKDEKIIITFKIKEQFILKTITPGDMDSVSEILIVR